MCDPLPDECSVCDLRTDLYGNIDERTGWIGWCFVCNAQWHLEEAQIVKAKTECYLKEVSSTNVFMLGGIASLIACYIACPEYELRLLRSAQLNAEHIYLTMDPGAFMEEEDSPYRIRHG